MGLSLVHVCKTFPTGIPKILILIQDAVIFRDKANAEMGERHALWDRVVEEYTACQFTKQDYKLVAISGVAAWMKGRFMGEYLCWLWKQEFDSECMWGLVGTWDLPGDLSGAELELGEG